jgi:hypothetical protein
MNPFRRKKKASKSESESRAQAMAALSRGASAAAATLVFGGLAVGVLVGAPRLQAKLAEQSAAAPVQITFEWPTTGPDATWVPPDVQRDLITSAQRALDHNPDPFSPDGLRRIAEAAAGSGWFDQIDAVRREDNNTIRVRAAWRTPAAVVRSGGRDVLVSRKGEVLPLTFEEGGSTLKAILGAQLNPIKVNGALVSGAVWPGDDVRAGLDLLATIAPRPWSSQVEAVDVADFASKKQLVLVTKTSGRVVWGGAVDDAVPGQVSTVAKLKRLDYIQAQFGAIDARHRIVEVAGPKVLVDDTATASAR